MKKLLIIGNGFDLRHGLKTQYNDFKEYLEKTYGVKDGFSYKQCPDYSIANHGEEIWDEKSQVQYFYDLLLSANGDDWSNLEESFCDFDFTEEIDEVNFDDDKYIQDVYNNEDRCRNVIMLFQTNFYKKLLKDWLLNINDNILPIKDIDDLIDKDTIIINFNYTNTIERLYNHFDDMIHIHGSLSEDYNDLLFGFDEDESYKNIDDNNIGTSYSELDDILRKNVSENISRFYNFFEKIKSYNIDEIYSIGFGYEKCDLKYVEKIISVINSERAVWNIVSKDENDGVAKERILKKSLNYTGKIIVKC